MRHRVDPDALHSWLLGWWGQDVAAQVCPEVEPERPKYDYHADWTRHPDPSGNNDVTWCCKYCDGWTDYRPKARHKCPDRPAEPVIDEAVFRAMYQAPEAIQAARDGLVASVNRELRSNACGGSDRLSSVSRATSASCFQSQGSSAEPSPAPDPRRLTDEEINRIWNDAPPCSNDLDVSRAVADAQYDAALRPAGQGGG
jgi:hypothetical protein